MPDGSQVEVDAVRVREVVDGPQGTAWGLVRLFDRRRVSRVVVVELLLVRVPSKQLTEAILDRRGMR